jgi:hypothetical protein
MTFLCAADDLELRTLSHLGGLLQRLVYLAETPSSGMYSHWGLARFHGDQSD